MAALPVSFLYLMLVVATLWRAFFLSSVLASGDFGVDDDEAGGFALEVWSSGFGDEDISSLSPSLYSFIGDMRSSANPSA